MNHKKYAGCYAALAGTLLFSTALQAQTLATGDSRTVRQPLMPPACITLTAQFSSSQRATPPDVTKDDTGAIQKALNTCAGTGKAVVLEASGTNNAFFSGMLTVNGEGLVIKSGVTLYGNTSYVTSPQFILVEGTNSSIFGPGTIDGRGDIYSGGKTPRLVQATNITNFNISNVTLTQALKPNLYVQGGIVNGVPVGNGFTAWGITILTPNNRANADGIDIDSMTNASVINSTINAGDDGVAIKSNSANTSNVTVSGNKLHGTHGISVGSVVSNTISNILFENNTLYATDLPQLGGGTSSDAQGIVIKTDPCALTVQNVSYVNTCMTGLKHLIYMITNYAACTGTAGSPALNNIVVAGAYSTASPSSAYAAIVGQNGAPFNVYLSDVNFDRTSPLNTSTGTPSVSQDQYANVYLYNSPSNTGGMTSTANFPSNKMGPGMSISSFTPNYPSSVPACSF